MKKIVVVGVVIAALLSIGLYLLRPRVTTVPSAELDVLAGRWGLDEEPLADPGWPDCTRSLVELRPGSGRNRVSVTIRPDEDVQCALAWRPVTWWVVDGERVDPPAGRRLREPRDPLLLMGAAGVSGSASIRLRCPVEEPVALFIDLGGEPVEVGSLKDPGCGSRGPRAGGMSFVYRYGGLETPAAWLDPRITDVETREGLLAFALEMLNDTDETITIGRCPFYEVRFTTSSKEAELRSYLNCPAAPDDLRPGDVARFLIELPLGGLTGEGRLGLELRDENRTLQRVELDGIEVPG